MIVIWAFLRSNSVNQAWIGVYLDVQSGDWKEGQNNIWSIDTEINDLRSADRWILDSQLVNKTNGNLPIGNMFKCESKLHSIYFSACGVLMANGVFDPRFDGNCTGFGANEQPICEHKRE